MRTKPEKRCTAYIEGRQCQRKAVASYRGMRLCMKDYMFARRHGGDMTRYTALQRARMRREAKRRGES